MKKIIYLIVLFVVAALVWFVLDKLSSDSIAMGLGIIFGLLASLPTAALLMRSTARREDTEIVKQEKFQPPVLIVHINNNDSQQEPRYDNYQPARRRQFKVIEDENEW